MGGDQAGPVPMEGHDFALWEKRVDALMVLCSAKGHFTVDGLRRALEDMGEDAFERHSYYERWIAAVNQNLIEAGIYSLEELADRMEAVAQRGTTYGEAAHGVARQDDHAHDHDHDHAHDHGGHGHDHD